MEGDDSEWMGKVEHSSWPPDLLGYESDVFLSKRTPFWCIPIVRQPRRKFEKEYGGIHASVHSSDIYWVSTMSRVRDTGYEGLLFLLNIHEKLSCSASSNSEWMCLHALSYSYQLPFSSPPLPPTPGSPGLQDILKRGNEGWVLWPQVDVQATSPSMCHLRERMKWGPLHAKSQSRKARGGNLA